MKAVIDSETLQWALQRAFRISPKQYEVMRLIAEGLCTKEIAWRLHRSHKTVEYHRSELCINLAVSSQAQIIRIAVQLGVVPPVFKPELNSHLFGNSGFPPRFSEMKGGERKMAKGKSKGSCKGGGKKNC